MEKVIVATGEHVAGASLGRLPQQVVVRQFVQQEAVLAECLAVISHAGSGTVQNERVRNPEVLAR